MTAATLRRYRADRLLREEFERLRDRVLAGVRARLATAGVALDRSDLEACYAQAWQGLYAAMLAGQQVANPPGWLALATYRRAIDEHRSRARFPLAQDRDGGPEPPVPLVERDIAGQLDDRRRLRELMEGLSTRLTEREREAAALCYLQGMTRSQAAARMGLSVKAMQKLMEGRSPERPGVAGKVGDLVEKISAGTWCAEQASLMRALAFGVLAPGGERHRLALMHQRECPACRTYVAALRGVAVVLPPVLTPLSLTGALAGGSAGGGAAAGGASAGSGAAGSGASAASGAGAGSGWLIGTPLTAKLAAGCLLALGVGAGCVAVTRPGALHAPQAHAALPRAGARVSLHAARRPARSSAVEARGTVVRTAPGRTAAAAPAVPAVPAAREFTPEQAPGSAQNAPIPSYADAVPASTPATRNPRSGSAAGPAASAAREFSPG